MRQSSSKGGETGVEGKGAKNMIFLVPFCFNFQMNNSQQLAHENIPCMLKPPVHRIRAANKLDRDLDWHHYETTLVVLRGERQNERG
jgi:hypothetical protein